MNGGAKRSGLAEYRRADPRCSHPLGSEHIFFFSSRRRHTRFDCDWSSDVCSSDLLGNPDAFFRDLGNWGLAVCGQAIFPDHHRFTQRDISAVNQAGKRAGANAFVTTEKDAQNLGGLKFEGAPLYVAVIDLVVTPEADFR